ncbi:TolC family protein [Chitinophagaceae bacterium LWZ2-11]
MTTITVLLLTVSVKNLYAQKTSLQDCFNIAKEKNILINQSKTSLLAKQYNLDAAKQSYLPKVDLLASYTYLSRPLEVNLQTVKDGIVTGSSQQAVNTANSIYQQITGNTLPQSVQDQIYNSSKNIISAAYPNYNPALSQQSYFLAGVGVRQPIYLGNKLTTATNFAQSEVNSALIGTQLVEKDVNYAIALQYIRILYLNTILRTQEQVVASFKKNEEYAEELVKNQILPPYQKSWTKVVLSQARTNYSNLQLDKKNALVEMNKMLGVPLDSVLTITDTLAYTTKNNTGLQDNFWENNPTFQLVQSKIATAQTTEKLARSMSLPNVFAVGNLNLVQNNLPVTIAPWLVGVEMQWTIFNGTQTSKRQKAAQQLVQEVRQAEENTKQNLQVQLQVIVNKIEGAKNEINTMDSARVDIATTRNLINERMINQLSSVKDVNDAILIQAETDKAYYTAVLGYYIAIATYWNIVGSPQRITEIIR